MVMMLAPIALRGDGHSAKLSNLSRHRECYRIPRDKVRDFHNYYKVSYDRYMFFVRSFYKQKISLLRDPGRVLFASALPSPSTIFLTTTPLEVDTRVPWHDCPMIDVFPAWI